MRKPRRRSAKQIRLIAGGGDAVACWCGSTEWKVTWERFPMQHVSVCKGCGVVYRGDLKASPAPKKPKPPESPFDGWPPFFYP